MIDFVIAGAGKSGTTTLADLLSVHPAVDFCRQKEPRFFTEVQESIIFPRSGTYKLGISWYQSLYEQDSTRLKGEASTIYFASPDTPRLLHFHAPQAKIIFILRNPIDRYYSHYWQEVKTGRITETFTDLYKKDDPRLTRYEINSSYRENIERYLEIFDKEQIQVIVYEDFVKSMQMEFDSICDFLGLMHMEINHRKSNPSKTPRYPILSTTIRKLKRQLKKRMVTVPSGLKKIGRKIEKANLRIQEYEKMPDWIRSELMNKFSDDISFFEEFLGRRLDSWNQK